MLSQLLAEAMAAGNIILYVEDLNTFLAGSGAMGTVNATELLKRFLTNPSIHIIATSDAEHFNRDIRPHPDLMQLFERVDVTEPTAVQSLVILERNLPYLEHGAVATYQALKDVVDKADLFFHDVPFPAKALALFNEVIADAQARHVPLVTVADVDRIVAGKTHAPVGQAEGSELEKLQHLEEYIHRDLVNQEDAVRSLSQTMTRLRAGITQRNKPAGSFLFTGPTGVGKTSAAQALAKTYFGKPDAMLRFDMSEYQAADAVDRFIGSVARSEPGQFVTKVRDMPFSVLLLDEIEKANPNVLNLLLQVLDEARLTDAFGKPVTFRQNIIVATSNAGSEFIRELVTTGVPVEEHAKRVTENLLKQGLFRPEFLNRFDGIIVFHPLTPEQIAQVARMMLEKFTARLKEQNYVFTFGDDLVAYLVQIGFDPQFGARPMQRALQNTVEVIVSRKIIAKELTLGAPFTVTVDEVRALGI